MGEAKRKALAFQKESIALDTFGGRIHASALATTEGIDPIVSDTGGFHIALALIP